MKFQLGIKKNEKSILKKEIPKETIKDDFITNKWRPMMAIMYMISCLADFVFFPIMFTIVQFWETPAVNNGFRQWVPITIQGGGLFHVAMGAVLGVSAFGRTQEKIAGVTTPYSNYDYSKYNSNYKMPIDYSNQSYNNNFQEYNMNYKNNQNRMNDNTEIFKPTVRRPF
jgi:hypothetical protein